METFRVRIDVENAAFRDDPGPELARILRRIANDVEATTSYFVNASQTIRDVNGNDVGRYVLQE